MHQVQQHQRDLEQTRDSYAFRERQIIDELDKNGNIKKTTIRELQVFFINSHQIETPGGPGRQAAEPRRTGQGSRARPEEIEKAEKTPPGQMTDV